MRGNNVNSRGETEADTSVYVKKMKQILEAFPMKGPPYNATELCPHIYIGSQRNADDIEGLRSLGITYVLNCAGTRRFDRTRSPYPKGSGIKGYFLIPAEDHDEYDMMSHFSDAIAFLDKAKEKGGKALVHCNLGINRCGTICAAYLMHDQNMKLLKMTKYMKLKRSVVLCNKGFRKQLVRYARVRGFLDAECEIEEICNGALEDYQYAGKKSRLQDLEINGSAIKSRYQDDDAYGTTSVTSAYCTMPRRPRKTEGMSDIPQGKLNTYNDEIYMELIQDILSGGPRASANQLAEPVQLLGHIFLGSQVNAESLRLLRKLGITHVLNCAGPKTPRSEPHPSPYKDLNIDYYEIQAEDKDTYDISRHFGEAVAYLDKVKRNKGTALVHCAMGINRSVAICVAYMMIHRNMKLLEAIRLVKRKRDLVLTNQGFHRHLIRYARNKQLLEEELPELEEKFKTSRKYSAAEEKSYMNHVTSDFLNRSRDLRRDLADISTKNDMASYSLPRSSSLAYSSYNPPPSPSKSPAYGYKAGLGSTGSRLENFLSRGLKF